MSISFVIFFVPWKNKIVRKVIASQKCLGIFFDILTTKNNDHFIAILTCSDTAHRVDFPKSLTYPQTLS